MIVICKDPEKTIESKTLAEELSCQWIPLTEKDGSFVKTDSPAGNSAESISLEEYDLFLVFDSEGLSLTNGLSANALQMRGDFSELLPRVQKGRLASEFLVKAAKVKGVSPESLTIFDATAGMGEDSFLLAAAGYRVELFEYNPVIAALLSDTVERAKKDPVLSEIACRMTVHKGDSTKNMGTLAVTPDIVLLDPMFPERQKSALIKKKFQLLQKLESPCSTEEELLLAAIRVKPKKIMIKRPLKGPNLAGIRPDYSFTGKAIRIDCLINVERYEEKLLKMMSDV